MLPLVVLVSGAPGSGKTTLARSLAHYMRLPHVERDTFLYGMEWTAGRKLERPVSIPLYYRHVAAMLKDGVSLVTDGTLYKNMSESDIKSYLIDKAVVINVHARAKNTNQRFYEREMNREGQPNDWVAAHMAHLEKIYPDTVEPLELGVETVEVDTNDGYLPSIEKVAASVKAMYYKAAHAVSQ